MIAHLATSYLVGSGLFIESTFFKLDDLLRLDIFINSLCHKNFKGPYVIVVLKTFLDCSKQNLNLRVHKNILVAFSISAA